MLSFVCLHSETSDEIQSTHSQLGFGVAVASVEDILDGASVGGVYEARSAAKLWRMIVILASLGKVS